MKTIICIIGKTATRKDTLAKYLEKYFNIPPVVSYTTRPKRDYEVDGVQHYFVSKEEMAKLKEQDDIIAYTKIEKSGYEYCATVSALKGDIVTYIINPDGINWMMEHIKDKSEVKLITIYMHMDEDSIIESATNRGDNLEAIKARLDSEREEMDKYFESKQYDFLLECKPHIDENIFVPIYCIEDKYTWIVYSNTETVARYVGDNILQTMI